MFGQIYVKFDHTSLKFWKFLFNFAKFLLFNLVKFRQSFVEFWKFMQSMAKFMLNFECSCKI